MSSGQMPLIVQKKKRSRYDEHYIFFNMFKKNICHNRNHRCLIILLSSSQSTATDITSVRDGTWGMTSHRGRGKFSTSPSQGSMLSYALFWLCRCAKQRVWVKLALWHDVSVRQPSPISAASSRTAAQRAVLSLQYLHKRIIAGASIKTCPRSMVWALIFNSAYFLGL